MNTCGTNFRCERPAAVSSINAVTHVLIQRFARRARFLRAVEHGDLFTERGQRLDEAFAVKRTIQPHFDHADLFALGDQMLHGFMRGFAAGTHQHDHALRVLRADVIEQIIVAAGLRGEFVHDFLDDVGTGGIKTVRRLAALEKHVGILRRAAQHRLVRRHGARAMLGDQLVVNQRAHHRFVEQFNLGNFVRRAEAVEEMNERQPRPQRRRLRNQREIHRLLHRGRAATCPSRSSGRP